MACTDLGACCTANGCSEIKRCFCTCRSGTFYVGATCLTLNSNANHDVAVNGWTAVSGSVTAGRTLVLTVTASGSAYGGAGKASWNSSGGETTAAGTTNEPINSPCHSSLMATTLHMKAIGRIRRPDGTYTALFEIGDSATIAALASGTLEFRQNDTCVSDNAGTYSINVKEYICSAAVPLSVASYAPHAVALGGPGTELRALLHGFGITAAPGCKCNEHAQEMDLREAETPGWCQANMDTILGWLQEQATARGMPFVRTAAKLLVKRAIWLAKRKSAAKGNSQ